MFSFTFFSDTRRGLWSTFCNTKIVFKDVFGICFKLLIDFFYIYTFYKKVNAEFNKLIKTVGHRALVFEKRC